MIKLSSLRNKHFLALTGNLVISAFSILMMSLLYRALSKTDIGTWFFFMSFLALADALRNGFLSTSTVKFYAGTDIETGKTVLGSIWYLNLVLTLGFVCLNGIVWLFVSHLQNQQMVLVVKWLGITFLSSMPFSFTYWVLTAEEDYEKILWLRLVNSGSMVIIIVTLMILKKMTLENMLILNVATNLLTDLVSYAWRLTHFYTIFKHSRAVILKIFHFGKYSLASNISSNLLRNTDTFIITFLLGPAALAIYNLPQRLMEIIELPLRSFVGTGMSSMAAAMNNNKKEEVLFIFKKYAGMLTFAFIPLALGGILFADLIVYILGGAKYQGTEAANIFRIFLVFSILYPIDRFNGVTLDIIHKPQVNFQKVLIMLTFSVVGDFLGVTIFKNMYGIAIVTPIVLFSGLIFGYYSLNKHLPYTFKEIFVMGWAETRWIIQTNLKKAKHSDKS